MSRYHNYFSPYIPVAQRKINAHKELDKLRKKGRSIEPLGELTHRSKIATSFWGNAWCKHLESFSDYDNRLPRGRTYVRNGSVLHLAIEPGCINALVQGSSLYEESVTIAPIAKAKWDAIQMRCKGGIGSLIELLQGKISDEIMRVVTDPDDGLFPKPSEIKLSCSCPDWATMCKHVAAVLYSVGARLDSRPELLFRLRGVDHNDLITAAVDGTALGASRTTASGGRRRTMASGKLNAVFGVDFDAAEEAAPKTAKKPESKPAKRSSVKAPSTNRLASKSTAKKQVSARVKKTPIFKPSSASIRKLRKRLALTRAEFAARLGMSELTIAHWESKGGTIRLQARSLAKLQAIAAE